MLDAVDGDDVGMVEGGNGAGLALEPAPAVVVGDEGGRQRLEDDFATERLVLREEHVAHAACPEQADDLIRPDPCAGRQCHRRPPPRVEGPAPSRQRMRS